MKAHVIENGKVANTIVVKSLSDLPNLVDATMGSVGDSYNNGVFTSPAPTNPRYRTADEAKAAMIAFIDRFTLSVTGPVPQDEKLSWDAKEQAAEAIIAETATAKQTKLIQDEADITGETAETLSATIVAKATAYRSVVSRVAGLRRATEAAIDAEAAKTTPDPFQYEIILENAQTTAATMAADLGITI